MQAAGEVPAGVSFAASEAVADSDSAESEELDEDEEMSSEVPALRRGRKLPKQFTDENVEAFHTCFNLADLIPPVPEKGEFDVTKIRKSQYFFS